jgi:hypothetical protein
MTLSVTKLDPKTLDVVTYPVRLKAGENLEDYITPGCALLVREVGGGPVGTTGAGGPGEER